MALDYFDTYLHRIVWCLSSLRDILGMEWHNKRQGLHHLVLSRVQILERLSFRQRMGFRRGLENTNIFDQVIIFITDMKSRVNI